MSKTIANHRHPLRTLTVLSIGGLLAGLLGGCGPADAAPTSQGQAATLTGTPTATPTTSASPTSAAPQTRTRTETVTSTRPFTTRTVADGDLLRGKSELVTRGSTGVDRLIYTALVVDGKAVHRTLVRRVPLRRPVQQVMAVGTKVKPTPEPQAAAEPAAQCDENYSGCVPIASDVDCAGGEGNGPEYAQGPVRVIGSDIYDLDRDGDGQACE